MNRATLLLTGLLVISSAAMAHHSSSMFDKTEVREVTATVKEFQWTNPHVWIQIVLKNGEGVDEEWSIEGLGPNGLSRNGWRRTSFKPGDVVEIRFNPMRDGSRAGGFIGAKFADGSTLGNWK